jgi:hypothetical protein
MCRCAPTKMARAGKDFSFCASYAYASLSMLDALSYAQLLTNSGTAIVTTID